MNIAILTLQSQNFGNRLQNYALQQVLRGAGHNVRTLRRARHAPFDGRVRRTVRKALKRDQTSRFLAFDDERMVFAQDVVEPGGFATPGLAERFDAFVIGSDQVWNPHFGITGDADYLPMVPQGKKVAYAASFGVSSLDEKRRAHTAELLKGISSISMREDAGAAIVRDLTDAEVPVVLDPTMLLAPDAWWEVEAEPLLPAARAPYCLKHVIGDDVQASRIETLASERGPSLPVGPAEFVWLVRNADLVCTDSFHGSVFATLFHRPFVIFERQDEQASMASRFDTLCRTSGLAHHRAADPSFDLDRCQNESWDEVDGLLMRERERSLRWLEGALEGMRDRAL